MHSCPAVSPTPHVGGPITGIGCLTVLIAGQPAATTGDICSCVGPPDVITTGSSGVFIGGKPVARMGDTTAHGGVIVSGCVTVLIGEKKKRFFAKEELYDEDEGVIPLLSKEEKRVALLNAIQECIRLLENRLTLLLKDDPDTKSLFQKWFGGDYRERKMVIVKRVRNALAVAKTLTEENFEPIKELRKRKRYSALVNDEDERHRIYIGYKFWLSGKSGYSSMAGVLVHELSHFMDVGSTDDFAYKEECISIAKNNSVQALLNADSFQFFVEGKQHFINEK